MKSKAMYITWKVNFSELRYPKVKPKMAAYEAFLGVVSLVLSPKKDALYEFADDALARKLYKPSFLASVF